VGVPLVMTLLGQGSAEVTVAATHLLQMLFNWYAGLEDHGKEVDKAEAMKKKGEPCRWPRLQLSEWHTPTQLLLFVLCVCVCVAFLLYSSIFFILFLFPP
jgi:hypothetical protein